MSPHVRAFAVVGCLALADVLAIHSAAAPPQVIKAVPDNGEIDVDPGLVEIRITFDQPMSPGGQSIVGGGDTFPDCATSSWVPGVAHAPLSSQSDSNPITPIG